MQHGSGDPIGNNLASRFPGRLCRRENSSIGSEQPLAERMYDRRHVRRLSLRPRMRVDARAAIGPIAGTRPDGCGSEGRLDQRAEDVRGDDGFSMAGTSRVGPTIQPPREDTVARPGTGGSVGADQPMWLRFVSASQFGHARCVDNPARVGAIVVGGAFALLELVSGGARMRRLLELVRAASPRIHSQGPVPGRAALTFDLSLRLGTDSCHGPLRSVSA